MRNAVDIFLIILCIRLSETDGTSTLFLERGQRGIVPCPLVKSHKIPPGDIDAMYWYYGSTSDTSLLISHFLGRVAPQNGIPEGVYDIDNEFNLIIENVTASNEGTYYFQVKPHLKMIEEGQVEVCDKVTPSPPFPKVLECNQGLSDEDECEVKINHAFNPVNSLTCVMSQVKPAVDLKWFRVHPHGYTELSTAQTVRLVVLPESGSILKNHTYSTSASVQVPWVDDGAVYVCEAVGVAVGSGCNMTVRLTKACSTSATYDDFKSSINPETTFSLADKVLITDYKLAETRSNLTMLTIVALSFSLVSSVLLFLLHTVYRRKLKHRLQLIEEKTSGLMEQLALLPIKDV